MNSAAGPVGRVWLPPTRQVKLAILEACRGSPCGVWLLLRRWPVARCRERHDRRCTRSPDYHPLQSHKACNNTLWHRQTIQGTTCFAASVRPAPLGRRGSSPDRDAVGCADVRASLDGSVSTRATALADKGSVGYRAASHRGGSVRARASKYSLC